jgi:tetratricopeptide (TPR) repeat protein
MSKPGRNDSCPCGSGKKYKKCCLPKEEVQRSSTPPAMREGHFITAMRPDLDNAVDKILKRLEMGHGRHVESDVRKLIEAHPDYHMTQYLMGVYQSIVMKDPAAAIPFFEAAVKIFPLFAEAHYNLGTAAVQKCDMSKAVNAFRSAEKNSPARGEIASMAREQLRSLQETLQQTTSFKDLDAYIANQRLFDEAFQCLRDKQFEKAVQLFKEVLSENPTHVQSYGNMALAYAALGQRSAAMTCFERALELDPDYQPARVNQVGIAQMKEGEPFIPKGLMEVDYYLDQVGEESNKKE